MQLFYPPLGDSARVNRQEINTVEVDGYGSLITPNGTFRTLRQKRTAIVSSTIEVRFSGNWNLLSSTLDTTVYYDWLAREAKGPLLSVEMDKEGQPFSITYTSNVVPGVTAPVADFSVSPRSDNSFKFTGRSENIPESWMWDFGDGATSNERSPTHTYPGPGEYTVCLIATNTGGRDTDGNTSTEQNPQHVYAAPGEYTVCLITSNSESADTACQVLNVVFRPITGFTYEVEGRTVAFTDTSLYNPTSWQWDFGDDATSMEQNPQHT